MVADCGATCAKYLLCLFNFVFFVVGSAVLSVGIWLAADKDSFIKLTRFSTLNEGITLDENAQSVIREFTEPKVIEQGAYILIAIGAFIFIISFLGYCGAIKESRVLLTAYGLILKHNFALQVAAIVLITIYKSHADKHTQDFLKDTINKYYKVKTEANAVTLGWDVVMSQMECCGVNNSGDFTKSKAWLDSLDKAQSDRKVPEACCILDPDQKRLNNLVPADSDCTKSPSTVNSNMNKGCYNKFKNWVQQNLNLVIGAVVGVAAVQLLGIIFSFCLCKAVGNERDYHYKY
jgi:tetraspanin-18